MKKLFSQKKKHKYSYANAVLYKNNTLLNTDNEKEVYLTEMEFNIIKSLIQSTIVSRAEIKKEILNLNADIETKSLDSHLSRIRKKIREIDLRIEILSPNPMEIKIK